MAALKIGEAAAQLGLSPRQLRYAIKQGAPVSRHGHKGRGDSATLVDPRELRTWFERYRQLRPLLSEGPTGDVGAEHRTLAAETLQTIAHHLELQFRSQSGPHKLALAANLVAAYHVAAAAIHAQLDLPPPDPTATPACIVQMDKLSVNLSRFDTLGRKR